MNGSPPVPHSTQDGAPATSSSTAALAPGHESTVVRPADFLHPHPTPSLNTRPRASSRPVTPSNAAEARDKVPRMKTQLDRDEETGLKKIRNFLRARTAYDVLPLSFRLIELDVALTVKESLQILVNCGEFGQSVLGGGLSRSVERDMLTKTD